MDERTFSRMAIEHAAKWHRLCYSILGNEADCEDAVQEALLRAWSGHASLREPQYFDTWFTRILINESRRILKKRARRPQVEAPAPPISSAASEALRYALEGLDLKLRLPVLLYHMEGYHVKEIAGMLGIPVPTAKWRLANGRKELGRLMEEANA